MDFNQELVLELQNLEGKKYNLTVRPTIVGLGIAATVNTSPNSTASVVCPL